MSSRPPQISIATIMWWQALAAVCLTAFRWMAMEGATSTSPLRVTAAYIAGLAIAGWMIGGMLLLCKVIADRAREGRPFRSVAFPGLMIATWLIALLAPPHVSATVFTLIGVVASPLYFRTRW